MAIITRGYNFSPVDQVTGLKLDLLVRNANIEQVSWSEFSGSTISISVYSAASNAPVGWISAEYELPPLSNSTYSGIWSEFNYLIKTSRGPVALCKFGGLETRLFVAGFGPNNGLQARGMGVYPATPSGGVTLTWNWETGNDAYGNPHFVGVNAWATATTSPTDPTGVPRIVMRGPTGVRTDAPTTLATIQRFIIGDAHLTNVLGATNSTSIDKIVGHMFEDAGQDAQNMAFLYGAPIWRT